MTLTKKVLKFITKYFVLRNIFIRFIHTIKETIMDDLIKRVTNKMATKNTIPDELYKETFQKFMLEVIANCDPNVYGLYPPKKIQRDTNNMFLEITNDKDIGDGHINKTDYFEVKVSVLSKNGRTYSIKNIRKYQNVDYFILILVDSTNWKINVFCVSKDTICDNPLIKLGFMSQTKEANQQNKLPLYSTTIYNDEIDWILGRKNELDGTTYNDLMSYIKKTYLKTKPANITYNNLTRAVRNERSRISFNVNGTTIKGENNKDAMLNLVRYIGPKNLDGVMWESQLKRYPEGEVNTPLGDGYFFNPKFSLRDIKKVINKINKKTNYYVSINNN